VAESHKKRYDGLRWQIVFGPGGEIDKTAMIELQRSVQAFLPYVVEIHTPDDFDSNGHLILLGTPDNNPALKKVIDNGFIKAPKQPQGYAISVNSSPFNPQARLVAIAGYDSAGMLYGVMDFIARVLSVQIKAKRPDQLRAAFDNMPDVDISEAPSIDERGIWTWGYVIYDYRLFIDNMMKLKMNMLTIWNDCVPLNIDNVISYAHARGVKIVLGFHWGWGLDDIDLSKAEDRRRIKEMVVENYRLNYMNLPIDGIYFQTLTEHTTREMGGRSVSSLACELVNETAHEILEIKPDLSIQFGLHAISIGERYTDLKDLDKRIVITWEDAGTIPYSYEPTTDPKDAWMKDYASPEQTLSYSKKLAAFRPGTAFALVPKGWNSLDWKDEFEHHGPFVLGERDAEWVKRRRLEKQSHWNRIDNLWLKNHKIAAKFYSEIAALNLPSVIATGLVEDGIIEEGTPISVRLFADTLWNPNRNSDERIRLCSSPFFSI